MCISECLSSGEGGEGGQGEAEGDIAEGENADTEVRDGLAVGVTVSCA